MLNRMELKLGRNMEGVSIAGVDWSGSTDCFARFVDLGLSCYLLLDLGRWSTELDTRYLDGA